MRMKAAISSVSVTAPSRSTPSLGKITHLIKNVWLEDIEHLYLYVRSSQRFNSSVLIQKLLLQTVWFLLSVEEMHVSVISNHIGRNAFHMYTVRAGVFVVSHCPLQDIWMMYDVRETSLMTPQRGSIYLFLFKEFTLYQYHKKICKCSLPLCQKPKIKD